jgi:polyhydroxybutyrate depolymerase
VPFEGGEGCGTAGVVFTSVPATMARWQARNGCAAATSLTLEEGDGRCDTYAGCRDGADVMLCAIEGGGHSWPGGEPKIGVIDCPADGPQSTTFHASEVIWDFFAAHPR